MLKDHRRIRLALYLLGIATAVAAPIVTVAAPDYGPAITTASGVLVTAALGTAATNRTPTTGTDERPLQ